MESLGFKQIKIMRKVGSGGESAAGKDPENKKYGRNPLHKERPYRDGNIVRRHAETMWSVDNPGYLLISRLSEIVADGLAKK